MEDNKAPKISNVEWGLVIGALFIIDLIQIGLDLLLQVGVVINRFIDVFVGLSLALYLQLRGQSLSDPKRIFGLIGTFLAEEIPDVDALPFWGFDGIYNMVLSKSTTVLEQIPGAGGVAQTTSQESLADSEDLEKAA